MSVFLKIFEPSDLVYVTEKFENDRYLNPKLIPASTIPLDMQVQFCIQPLNKYNKNEKGAKSIRAGINISNYRNFLFESDKILLEEQLEITPKLFEEFPIRLATYSGSKSIHYIISLSDTLISGQAGLDCNNNLYKMYWKGLETVLSSKIASLLSSSDLNDTFKENPSLIFDQSTKDPVKLSRVPGAFREISGKRVEQKIIQEGELAFSENIIELASKLEFNNYLKQNERKASLKNLDVQSFQSILKAKSSLHWLKHKLENPEQWASNSGMYHELFKLALWSLDATGVSYETLNSYMNINIYPTLKTIGYPRNPSLGVFNAYKWKNLI
jgi:hypothetical protein